MSTTHDELAYAVATESIAAIRAGTAPWNDLFPISSHVTSSRQWPVPDFVVSADAGDVSAAAEFKPPDQTKREYLTGLGQALAYTRDFDYALLVVPEIADDGYKIAEHIQSVLDLPDYCDAPIALLRYDPGQITPAKGGSTVARFCKKREHRPATRARLEVSFYAKWREMSDEELGAYIRCLYQEQTTPASTTGTIRDRGWKLLWEEIQRGKLHNWQGQVRRFNNTPKSYEANAKNWRNFPTHIGWCEADGTLTAEGLKAHHTALIYGSRSQMFRNLIARAVLGAGKHLILLNTINEYQDEHLRHEQFDDEGAWLEGIEEFLEGKGLLKRNPERGEAATRGQERGFLKAEKQLWKELGFVVPRNRYVFHPGRGFIFNWARITELVKGL